MSATISITVTRVTQARVRTVREAGLVLALALACLPAAGCGAHLPFLHRGAPAPAAAHLDVSRPSPAATPAFARVDSAGPEWPYRLAVRDLAADSLALAESQLREALARAPRYAPALSLLSKVYFLAGRHAEAVALLQPVLAHPDEFAPGERRVLLAGLALHEDALGQRDLAREAMAAAPLADCDPTVSADIYMRLRGESPDSADALAREALEHDGTNAVHLNNFGITRLRAGDLDGARMAFTSAIERDPSLGGPYYNLAILEKFYRFDDNAGARWFAAYWTRSHADPDGLRGVFPADLASVPAPQEEHP